MPPAIVNTTLQAAGLSALSNLLAQGVKAYRTNKRFTLNLIPITQFVVFTILSCPPNVLWQEYMEAKFPAYTLDYGGEISLDTINTAKKLILDQTVGALVNTALFIAGMAALKGKPPKAIIRDVERDFWPLVRSGWKLWPMVALLNFALVPVNRRILVGSIIGLFWGIYLSLFVAKDDPIIGGLPKRDETRLP